MLPASPPSDCELRTSRPSVAPQLQLELQLDQVGDVGPRLPRVVVLAPPAPAHEVLVLPRARKPLQQRLRLPHVALQVALDAAPDGSGCGLGARRVAGAQPRRLEPLVGAGLVADVVHQELLRLARHPHAGDLDVVPVVIPELALGLVADRPRGGTCRRGTWRGGAWAGARAAVPGVREGRAHAAAGPEGARGVRATEG